jgi:hypothetical protein
MGIFVVPHQVTKSSVHLWIGWWERPTTPRPLYLTLKLYESGNTQPRDEISLSDNQWSRIGADGQGRDEVSCEYRVVRFYDLRPDQPYRAVLVRDAIQRFGRDFPERVLREAEFETLPDGLLSHGQRPTANIRPFTILFGSCYSQPHDTGGKVDACYQKLWSSNTFRPHLKLLLGDQVYVDQPAPMRGRMSSDELRRHFIPMYRRTWARLHWMLEHGGNYLTSDDHEFWNDYPERPHVAVWTLLHNSLQYRRDWGNEAKNHFYAIQQPIESRILNIGHELSIFIADTRVNRARGNQRFMSANDFRSLVTWVGGLSAPGVLILGQPFFDEAVTHDNIVGLTVADHNLAYYRQYWLLLRSLLRNLSHDLLILAGDVHFARIADWQVKAGNARQRPIRVTEIVSSGMAVLPSARAFFAIPQPATVDWPPTSMPRPGDFRGGIERPLTYQRVLPRRAQGTENHFTTLQFTKHPSGRGVRVEVRPWLLSRPIVRGLPQSAWIHTVDMDV